MSKKNKKEKAVYHIVVGDSDHHPTKSQLEAIAKAFKKAKPDGKFIATDASVTILRIA